MEKPNLILEWIAHERAAIESRGFQIVLQSSLNARTSTVVDFEGEQLGGRVCFWPPNVFEFQFHQYATELVSVETIEATDTHDLSSFFTAFLSRFDTKLD